MKLRPYDTVTDKQRLQHSTGANLRNDECVTCSAEKANTLQLQAAQLETCDQIVLRDSRKPRRGWDSLQQQFQGSLSLGLS